MADPISFLCPNCNREVEADGEYAGASLPCPFCEQSVVVPFLGLLPGRPVGPFELKKRIGCGGMGEVWLAHHSTLDRNVALKILSPTLTKDASFVERFMKESRMAAKIEHPNIITAYDGGFDQGVYYLATSFIEGNDLEHILKTDGRLSEEKSLAITKEMAIALRDAWNKNKILHRDIKPANIMLASDGSVKLMDMGLAKCFDESISMTMTGTVMGTPHYMSPEQARGDSEIDFRTDIYSLGATLYHSITGIVPFDAETAMGVLSKHLTEPLKDPKQVYDGISLQAAQLITIMMNKDRDRRQCCWEEVIEDIDSVMDGRFPIKSPMRKKQSLKKPLLILASTALLLFLAIAAFFIIRKIQRNRTQKANQAAKIDNNAAKRENETPPANVKVAKAEVDPVNIQKTVNRDNPGPDEFNLRKKDRGFEPPKDHSSYKENPVKHRKKKKNNPEREKVIEDFDKILKRTGYSLQELKASDKKFDEFRKKKYSPMQVRLLFKAMKDLHEDNPDLPMLLNHQEKEIMKALNDAARDSIKKRVNDFRNRRGGDRRYRLDFRGGGDRRPPQNHSL